MSPFQIPKDDVQLAVKPLSVAKLWKDFYTSCKKKLPWVQRALAIESLFSFSAPSKPHLSTKKINSWDSSLRTNPRVHCDRMVLPYQLSGVRVVLGCAFRPALGQSLQVPTFSVLLVS